MKGKVPTYFVGKRTDMSKVRVLIQEERPATREELKRLGYKQNSGWISLGGYHIMTYGLARKAVFHTVFTALQQPEVGKQKTKQLEKDLKEQIRGFEKILKILQTRKTR